MATDNGRMIQSSYYQDDYPGKGVPGYSPPNTFHGSAGCWCMLCHHRNYMYDYDSNDDNWEDGNV